MESARDLEGKASFVVNFLGDRKDHRFGRGSTSLGPSKGNGGSRGSVVGLVDIDGDQRLFLDLIDLSSSLAKNSRKRFRRNREDDDVSILLLVLDEVDEFLLGGSGTLFPSLDGNLVGVPFLFRSVGLILAGVLGEVDSNIVISFEALEVRSLLSNKRTSLEGGRKGDGESDFVGLVCDIARQSEMPRLPVIEKNSQSCR